jgi:hypothetical protein
MCIGAELSLFEFLWKFLTVTPTPVDFDIIVCYSIFVEAMNRALRMVAE